MSCLLFRSFVPDLRNMSDCIDAGDDLTYIGNKEASMFGFPVTDLYRGDNNYELVRYPGHGYWTANLPVGGQFKI